MKNNILQIVLVSATVIFLVLLCDPFMVWMPEMMEMTVLLIATALVIVLAGLVVRESGGDEREATHRMHAGRVAYLSGIATLTLGLLIQGFSHSIDIWVPITLVVMVVSRLGARLYVDKYR